MTRTALGLAALLALAPGCGRDFAPPPPAVALDGATPARGFAGDRVVLCGRNLEPEAALNLVYFDTELAEVLAERPDPLPDGCGDAISVVVPTLGEPGDKALRVSTATSQAAAPEPFLYLGAGHPPEERVGNAFRVRTGPVSLALPVGPAPAMLALLAGVESASLDFLFLGSGIHAVFGSCLPPLSAAFLLTPSTQPGIAAEISVYAVLFAGGETEALEDITRLSLTTMQLTSLGGYRAGTFTSEVPLPATGGSFVPGSLYGACPDPACQAPGVIVTHIARPGLAFLPAAPAEPWAIDLYGTPPLEPPPWCLGLGTVSDVTPRIGPAPGHLLASVANTADLWDVDLAAGAAALVSPPSFRCGASVRALSARRLAAVDTEERVYAASGFSVWAFAGQADGSLALAGTGEDAVAYVATSGIWDLTGVLFVTPDLQVHERLIAAAEDGLHVLDVTDPGVQPLPLVAFVPWPSGYNTSQSLAVYPQVDPAAPAAGSADYLLYMDPTSDTLLGMYAGAEKDTLMTQGLGPTLPALAFARRSARIFLADYGANMIRPVDPRSSAQGEQIFPGNGAPMSIWKFAALEIGQEEYLLATLLSQTATEERDDGRSLQDRLAVARLGGDPLGCIEGTGLMPTLDLAPLSGPDLSFHDLFVLPGEAPELVLVRYGEDETPGWLRFLSIQAEEPAGPAGAPVRLGEAASLEVALPPQVQLLTASPRHGLVAALLAQEGETGTPGGALLAVLDREDFAQGSLVDLLADAQLEVLGPATAMFVTDMAVARAGPADAKRTLVGLALAQLGEVQVIELTPDAQPRTMRVATGGLPIYLAVSPDERRLYVVHPNLGQVQAISLCPDPPACAADPVVSATLEVDPWPYRVFFSPSGDQAFVSHLLQGGITLIE